MAKKTQEPTADLSPWRQVQLAYARALEPFYGPLHRKRIERAIEADRAELDGEVPVPATAPKGNRGRPTTSTADRLRTLAGFWIAENGLPARGERAELEEFLAKHAGDDLKRTRIQDIAREAHAICEALRKAGN
jgi:hypothetical protein